jgi:hypothetical protein
MGKTHGFIHYMDGSWKSGVSTATIVKINLDCGRRENLQENTLMFSGNNGVWFRYSVKPNQW